VIMTSYALFALAASEKNTNVKTNACSSLWKKKNNRSWSSSYIRV